MLGQKYLRLRNAPHLWKGPKPCDAVPRQPSQAWRGWGEQGVHVINIKSLSATNRRRILYIFDPYTQEHNIHRTPRRSGGFARGFREVLFPCQPPCASPPRRRGLYRQHISHQKSRQAGAHHSNRAWMEWSPPAVPAPLPWGRGRRRGWREGERAGARGSLANPQSAWGLRTLGAKLGPERNFLPCRPRGEGFSGRAGL